MQGVWQFDLDAFRAIHLGLHSSVADLFFLAMTYLGVGQAPVIYAILFWISGRKQYILPMAITSLATGLLLVHVLKDLIPRERPSNLVWAKPEEPHFSGSFPSGHTTLAFSIAAMLWLLTRESKDRWLGIIAWPLASLVGLSRIYRGVHWPTDVMAGACLGTLGSSIIWLAFRKFSRPDPNPEP